MSFPYSTGDVAGEKVLHVARAALSSSRIFATANRKLIFVCGGERGKLNLRSHFLDFVKANLPDLRVILAEEAYRDILSEGRSTFLNLAIFENLLADLSDCVVIFPESRGSIAELGFFVSKAEITQKLLAVNPLQYQGEDSFLNLGPIALVNECSDFRPTLQIVDKAPPDFTDVAKRLERISGPRRRIGFPYKSFNDYTSAEKLFALFELIRMLRLIHAATLPYTIETIFGELPDKENIKHLLSVLVAAKYVNRVGEDERYLIPLDVPTFLDIPDSKDVIIASNRYLLRDHLSLYTLAFETLEAGAC